MLKKKIFNFFFILIIGGLGGILADRFFLPYLVSWPWLAKIKFIQQAGQGTTIINPTEKIIITENTALEQAIDKISPCLVGIKTFQNEQMISQGTGFILTSDGLVVTANDLVPIKATQYSVFRDGRSLNSQVIRRDLENNLALLRIEEKNLPVVSLINLEDLDLGQRIILIGLEEIKGEWYKFVNLGIIRSISKETLKINLIEENILANGGPLLNDKGEVIGLNLVSQKGLLKTIPNSKIRNLLSF